MDCLFGLGDGDLALSCASRGRRVVACLIGPAEGGEPDPTPALRERLTATRRVEVCRLRGAADVRMLVFELYPDMLSVLDMADLCMHGQHAIPAHLDDLRDRMIREFCHVCMTLPCRFGNSALDALTGACRMMENLRWWLSAPPPQAIRVPDRPIVAVGAGPSLTRHVEHLRRIRDQVTIIAADSAVAALCRAGITYDLVCSLERSEVTSRKLRAVDSHGSAVLVCLPYVPPEAAETFGRVCRASHEDALFRWSETDMDAVFYTGSTSGVMTVGLAEYLNSGRQHPIYLVGHDCSYDDRVHHAEGAVYDQNAMAADLMHVQGHGRKVPTTNYLFHAGLAIERIAAGTTTRMVNVAGSGDHPTGMRIGQVEVGPLPEPSWLGRPDGAAVSVDPVDQADGERRREGVLGRLRALPSDLAIIRRRFATRQDLRDYHVDALPGGNTMLGACLLRPMLCQASIEAKMGRPTAHIQDMLRQRMHRWYEECVPSLLAARHIAQSCVAPTEQEAVC